MGKISTLMLPSPRFTPPPKREDPAKDHSCLECGEKGHWKRNLVSWVYAHRTPPYTPHNYNGVSEWRNRNHYLDMVRSMMSSNNSSKCPFGNMLSETAACILNIVPNLRRDRSWSIYLAAFRCSKEGRYGFQDIHLWGYRTFSVPKFTPREAIEFDDLKLEKVHTDDNLVIPFT
ncbi:retrotransposon protein, putative, ty1-copia subclass [Tanacetum coccineum]